SDLDNVNNLLAEHAKEWHGMHFPELEKIVRDNALYLKLVYFLGERKNFEKKKLKEFIEDSTQLEIVEKKAKESMGSDIDALALAEIKLLALNALNLIEERKALEAFIEKEMNSLAKNFSAVAGAVLGAKLLAEAGNLKNLALMPSSTIQLLGAKKALFRHLKNRKARSPKYGFLYTHALVKTLPGPLKGKMARTISGKLCIAAKADYFGKGDISKNLLQQLEARAKALKESK
ncbi:MAG: hypothetical protein JW772_04225, partial [Candidatus Diapherotrites archaeon]|nr:hypothetical protein [Candidatus Diapherotrites archaeon]